MSNRARRLRHAFVPLIPLTALLVLFFGPAIFGSASFVFRDAAHFYYPLFAFTQSVWGEGRIPMWNPYDGVGMPLLAEPSASVFYPGKLLFALPIAFPTALRLYVIGHFGLAYLTSYNAARRLGISRSGAILTAISYSFGGYVVATHANVIFLVGAAWAPLALLAGVRLASDVPNSPLIFSTDCVIARMRSQNNDVSRYLASREELCSEPGEVGKCHDGIFQQAAKKSAAPLLALSLAMMILGGDPQAAFHLALVAGCFFLCRHWRSLRTPLLFVRRGVPLAAAILLAAGLAAVQILPTMQWAARSRRSLVNQPRTIYSYAQRALLGEEVSADVLLGKVEQGTHEREAYQFSLGPWRWPELIWANFGGKMYPRNQRWTNAIPAEGRVWAPSLYVGGTSIVLAMIGGWTLRRQTLGKLLMALTAIGVIGSLGWYGIGWLLIELGHDLRLWSKESLGVGEPFGGLYWLLNCGLPGYASFRYPAKLWLLAALAGSLLTGFGFDAERERGFRWLTRLMLVLAAISCIALSSATLLKAKIIAAASDLPPDLLFGPLDGAAAAVDLQLGISLSIVAAVIVIAVTFLGRSRPAIIAPLLVALMVADLYVGLSWTIATAPDSLWESCAYSAEYQTANRWYRRLSANDYPPEFADKTSADRQVEGLRFDRRSLFPRYYLLEKVGSIVPSNSLAPADYTLLLDTLRAERTDFEMAELLSAAGVIRLDRDYPSGQMMLHGPRPKAIPMAWIADGQRSFPLDDLRSGAIWREAADALNQRQGRLVLLHDEETAPQLSGPSRNEIIDQIVYDRVHDDVIELDVSLAKPSYVVVQEYYDAGWVAEIELEDGQTITAPTERANVVFQAIALPAGRHQVTLRYAPPSFYWGASISLASVLALALWAAFACRPRK
ncbi:YfhO family protein [Blastopirellula retiformator]|uniref:Bacterial membrane protein YfhO n=1 Tax=Blastopirellula retiformator TaxID=2527970 RepID=A0A5C5VNV8_9BACT|nr:YfhO family protein [Blastopirellula retiformator]TWT39770.1 Bacterial membrane protein YfhO [Blastopirellula retiformator]